MDYVIIVGLVIVLVCVQFKVFLNNCKLIKEVENLFPLSNTLFVLQNSLKDNALIDDIHETGGNVESIKVFKIVSADLDKNSSEFRKILDLQSPNQKIPDRKTKCVIKTHINIKQNVIFGAKLKPV